MPIRSLTLSNSRTLRYFAFFYLYVMQGIPAGFALTAVANYLIAEKVDAKVVGTFVATVGFPWTIQFIWGPLIDRFQHSVMGNRKPWVLLAQLMALLASLAIWQIHDPVQQIPLLSAVFFVHSIFASIQDASVDAMAIAVIPEHERGRTNACMRGGFLFGIGVGAASLSYLIRHYSFFHAAVAQSILLMLMMGITFFIKERPGDAWLPFHQGNNKPIVEHSSEANKDLRWLFVELFRGFFASQSLRIFVSVALVYGSISTFVRTYSVHLIQELHWTDTSLSFISGTYGTTIALSIILVGGILADRIGSRRLLVIVMTTIACFLLLFDLLAPFWNIPAISTFGLFVRETFDSSLSVAAIPVFMSICRKGVEGSQFTAYMALINLSDVTGAFVSGYALQWLTAPVIGLLCGALVIVALLITRNTFQHSRLPTIQ